MQVRNIEKLFKTFATPTRVYSESVAPYTASSYGFLQPLRYKNKMYVDTHMTELGLDDDGRYVYIGLPCNLLTDNTGNDRKIDINGKSYSVIRAENVFYKGEAIYVWAIIKRDRGGNFV